MFWDYQPSTNKANLLNSLLWIKNISESSFITASDTHLISIIILNTENSLFTFSDCRGAVSAVPHGRLHHPAVLRDAALHRAQPDMGAEGTCQRLRAQPQPFL